MGVYILTASIEEILEGNLYQTIHVRGQYVLDYLSVSLIFETSSVYPITHPPVPLIFELQTIAIDIVCTPALLIFEMWNTGIRVGFFMSLPQS